MNPADLAELGSRLPENVRALELRKNPMFVLTYRGVPFPYRVVPTVLTSEEYERLTGRKWPV